MNDTAMGMQGVTRVTCVAHQRLSVRMGECLKALGIGVALVESARCVRQRVTARMWGLAGSRVEWDESPKEIFRLTVAREAASAVVGKLMLDLDLATPGRGAVYAQDIREIGCWAPPSLAAEPVSASGALSDLALITGIMSRGDGEGLARIALKLGVAVPVIGLGYGTGIRDRMGLLRITIPPEKDVVRVMVSAHDAASLLRLFVEEARLDRPGGGFLYQTPIRLGATDSLIRLGHQEHAARIEQIITAIDDLKGGMSWRKRFAEMGDQRHELERRWRRGFREIVFVCAEGRAEKWAQVAMLAGASGVIVTRVSRLDFNDAKVGVAACERGVTCVPGAREEAVLAALRRAATDDDDCGGHIQILDAPVVFSHH